MKKGFIEDTVPLTKNKLAKLVNPKRMEILKILEKEGKIHQRDIQKKLDISYAQTLRYIKSLKDVGLVKRKAIKKRSGSPVFISLKK